MATGNDAVSVSMVAPTGAGLKVSPSMAAFESAGMRITFKDLTHTVESNTEAGVTAYLLKDVSGYLQPSEMTALMGPSGSGKTTLLDILSGRKNIGVTTGQISFSGSTPSRAFLRRFTGYVEQFDTLLAILTVREMLMYTAELKRHMEEPYAEKLEAVNALLDKLALRTCENVKIGSKESKGISGGQAKRVNIGIALITNPRVIFLDEPTSGLDSYTANEIMTVVKQLVHEGVTITATIHSPTQYAFSLFDSLMMLVRGRVVYFGRQNAEAIEYAKMSWTGKGDVHSDIHNQAEWLVDLVTAADRAGNAVAFADQYAASEMKVGVDEKVNYYLDSDHTTVPDRVKAELATDSETVTPWWFGLKTLVKYRTPRNYRDADFLGPRIGDKIVMTTLMWTLYWGIGGKMRGDNYVNIAAVLFMWCVLPAYGAASYVPAIVLERQLYVRERADGLYLPITYLLAKMLDELMIAGVMSVGVAAAAFFAIDFQGSYGLFWLVYYVTLMIGIVLAYFVAAICPNMDVANAVLPIYVTMLLFFGGFLFDFNTMPGYWKWFSYLDFVRYAWGALMMNQFEANDPMWTGGKTVLQHYGLKDYHGSQGNVAGGLTTEYTWYTTTVKKYENVGFMMIFFLAYFCLAWLVLAKKQFQKR